MPSDFGTILSMRKWDEAAKLPDAVVPPLSSYVDLLCRHISSSSSSKEGGGEGQRYILSPSQIEFYEANSYLKIPNLLHFHNIDIEVRVVELLVLLLI